MVENKHERSLMLMNAQTAAIVDSNAPVSAET